MLSNLCWELPAVSMTPLHVKGGNPSSAEPLRAMSSSECPMPGCGEAAPFGSLGEVTDWTCGLPWWRGHYTVHTSRRSALLPMFIQRCASRCYCPSISLPICNWIYLRKSSKLPILGINKGPVGSKLTVRLSKKSKPGLLLTQRFILLWKSIGPDDLQRSLLI